MMARVRNVSDIVSPAVRSRMMSAVKHAKTVPELKVRRIVRAMGFWFSVHNRDLPGSPDLANRRKRWAIFVNGCFWHGHKRCLRTTSRAPRTNATFWAKKFRDNRRRDAKACRQLRDCGYRVAIVWECALIDETAVGKRLRRTISGRSDAGV